MVNTSVFSEAQTQLHKLVDYPVSNSDAALIAQNLSVEYISREMYAIMKQVAIAKLNNEKSVDYIWAICDAALTFDANDRMLAPTIDERLPDVENRYIRDELKQMLIRYGYTCEDFMCVGDVKDTLTEVKVFWYISISWENNTPVEE